MLNSNNQLTRILTIGLVLGSVLFITLAQIAHFKSKDNTFSGETIYIQQEGDVLAQQEEGAITTQGSQIAEQPEEIISTEMEISQTEGDISNNNWAETSLENIGLEQVLNFEHISSLVTNMNASEREKILSDQQLFKQVIENEANNRSAIIAAVNNQLNEHPNVKFMMKRNAENMLLEFYLNLLVKRKLPQEFPSNEDMIAYYESNKETQFTFPLRARIWQIFLSKPKDVSEEEALAIQRRAEEIISKKLSQGPVFLNFTADWCITCKVNERIALKRESISALFDEKNISYIEIDWTNKNDEIAKKLASFGRSSIPLYVYYASENAEPILLPEILTENIIKDYLR